MERSKSEAVSLPKDVTDELVGPWAGFTFVSPEELANEELTSEDLEILVGGIANYINCPPVPAAMTKLCQPGKVVCVYYMRFSCG